MDRLIQFFQPPKFDDEETTYRARILTIILNYLTLVLILYIGLAWLLLAPMFDRIWLAILSLLVMVVARIIMLRGAVRAASLMLVILVWLLLMTWALFYGGVHAPTYALLTIVVVIATLLLGLRGGLVVALLSGLGGLVSLLVFGTRVITVQYSGETAVITWLGISLLFFACAGLVGIVRQNTENSIKQAYREIAERQRIEHELRMSEEKFAKAFRSSPNALVISELETSVILDINESFETLSGYNRAEIIGRKATEINFYTTPEHRSQWQQEFMQKGRIRDLEMDLHRKDGVVRLVSLSIEGIELGGVDCVLSIVQDVTETKKAEESLKRYAKKVQRDADRLAMLNEIGRTVSTQQDLPSVLEAIYQQARQRMQIDAFHVGLYHPEINEISYPIMYDEGEKYEMENVPAVGDHFILRIVRSGKPIWINRTEEELATPIDPKGMMGNESRKSASLMYIPLVTPEAIIGVISAQSYTLNAYDEDDLALLSGIGYQVAVAVENARLVTALRHELGERERAEAEVLRTQASLHEREAHLRTILDNMPFLIWLKDRNGRYLAVNQAMAEYGGYDNPQRLIGQTGISIVTPEQSKKHQVDDREVMSSGQPKSSEERIDHQGTSQWFETYRAPILGDDGAIMGTFGFARDITERKKSEVFLQESEARFRSVFEDSAIGMVLVRLDYSLAKVNHVFCQMLGYTEEELQGQYFIDITHPYDVQISLDNLSALFAGTVSSYQFEKRYVHKQGHDIWVRLNVSAVRSTSDLPRYAIAQVEDIMARKQAEADREKLIRELEGRNGELERFAYTVSHDLKTPLITIGGFLGYLEMDAHSGNLDQLDDDIRNIREAVGKMRLLLDELLELSRIGRLMNPPEVASLTEIVQDALALVHGRLTEKHIRVTVQPDLPTVLGDKARLVEVVQNLVDNAAKYMGDQAAPRIWIGVDEIANQQVYYVRDNGMGIAPAYQEQIFGLFNKLNPDGEGTGIGLALVKRIVEVHNGRLWVESEGIDQGSTFKFTLNEDMKTG